MKGELLYIALEKIRTNPVALRNVARTSEDFLQLVDSVKQRGIINAISVRRKPGEDGKEYELIDGLHRFSAAGEAGLTEIPAQVKDQTDAEAMLTQVIGNSHKVETKPAEYAKHLMRILGYHPTMTEAQLASLLSRSPAWISQQMSLNRLHAEAKKLVDDGKIPLQNAYMLAKLPMDEQINWLQRATESEAAVFGTAIIARDKEIKAANRQGRDAAPEQFVPVAHLRKKTEIEVELKENSVSRQLIQELEIAKNAEDKAQAAMDGFKLGLQWAINFDPKSIEAQKADYEAHKKEQAEAKARREAERNAKREKEKAEKEKAALDAVAAVNGTRQVDPSQGLGNIPEVKSVSNLPQPVEAAPSELTPA